MGVASRIYPQEKGMFLHCSWQSKKDQWECDYLRFGGLCDGGLAGVGSYMHVSSVVTGRCQPGPLRCCPRTQFYPLLGPTGAGQGQGVCQNAGFTLWVSGCPSIQDATEPRAPRAASRCLIPTCERQEVSHVLLFPKRTQEERRAPCIKAVHC